MVYRDLPSEEIEKRYSELTATIPPKKEEEPKPKPKKKVVKVIVPKTAV
jgi:hypothetical protein